jgi:hypothetical protein
MQYLLTQEEFDKLGGNREAMRKEFQAKMDAKIGEFSKALTMRLQDPLGYRPSLMLLGTTHWK